MEIDIFTFVIQIINLCILVFLLNKFLFSKVRKIMDERNSRIIKMTEDAKTALEKAENLRIENQKLVDDYEIELKNKREFFYKEMEVLRENKLSELKQEIEVKREKEIAALESEISKLGNDFIEKYAGLITNTARKVLLDIIDVELERKLFDVFLKKLDSLNIAHTKKDCTNNIIFRSSFPILDIEKELLTCKLNRILGIICTIDFNTTSSSPLPNISIIIFDDKIEISFEKYLEEIEQALRTVKDVK